MNIFTRECYIARRRQLKAAMKSGVLLLMGNDESSMNYKDNWYPFRQDSSFLYFFGIDIPGLTAIIDIDDDKEIIFGDDTSVEDSVWTGSVPRIAELASLVGVDHTLPRSKAGDVVRAIPQGRVHYLPPFRPENSLKISEWLNIALHKVNESASVAFIKAVVNLRSYKATEEIVEINKAVDITADMHLAAMELAKPGLKEYTLAGAVHGKAISSGGQLSFPIILTINGQILHNHFHGNTLPEDRMVLCDAGAESAMHYAGDLTRTFPTGVRFSSRQKEIYQIVEASYRTAVAALRPGVEFKEIHLMACRKLAEGLKAIGLMKGNVEDAVAQGAHAMFFPCGLGHMMGLDVHDMEDLGEQYVGYTEELKKSTQFGLKSLRLGRALEKGFVLTVEPGIYLIPELMDAWYGERRFTDYIHYDNLMKYRSFGGIRIEDDFLISESGAQKLGKSLPTSVDEIEAFRSRSLERNP